MVIELVWLLTFFFILFFFSALPFNPVSDLLLVISIIVVFLLFHALLLSFVSFVSFACYSIALTVGRSILTVSDLVGA